MSGNFGINYKKFAGGNFGFITGPGDQPPAALPVSIAIVDPGELTEGDTGRLRAVVTYDDGSTKNSLFYPNIVNFSSSDPTKLQVSANGQYEALVDGTVTATATSTQLDTITGTLNITIVDPILVTAVNIVDPGELTTGDTGTIYAVVTYSDASQKDTLTYPGIVSFVSSDPTKLIIDETTGDYQAPQSGTVSLTATSTELTSVSDSLNITITDPLTVSSIEINDPGYIAVGDRGTITATISYSDGSSKNTADHTGLATFTSDNESKFPIDAVTGDYVANGIGLAPITATSTENATISDSFTVSINEWSQFDPVSVVIEDPGELTVGDTGTINAVVTYSDGSKKNSKDVRGLVDFSSTNSAVFSVDVSTGDFSAASAGSASVSANVAQDPGVSDFKTLTINEPPATFDLECTFINNSDGASGVSDVSISKFLGSTGTPPLETAWKVDETVRGEFYFRSYHRFSPLLQYGRLYEVGTKRQWLGFTNILFKLVRVDDGEDVTVKMYYGVSRMGTRLGTRDANPSEYGFVNDADALTIANFVKAMPNSNYQVTITEDPAP